MKKRMSTFFPLKILKTYAMYVCMVLRLKVAQCNQTYCRKVKSISAIDFQYLRFVLIFAIFYILSNKNAKIHKNLTQSTLFNCFFHHPVWIIWNAPLPPFNINSHLLISNPLKIRIRKSQFRKSF